MLATIANAAALMSDHQNYVHQITKWTARANQQQLPRHWLINSQYTWLTRHRTVTSRRTGLKQQSCKELMMRLVLGFSIIRRGLGKWLWSWIRVNTRTRDSCYYSPSSCTLHQLNGIMRFHLHCYDLHCTAIGYWLAVAFRKKNQWG